MRRVVFPLLAAILLTLSLNCDKREIISSSPQSGIEGRVYGIGAAAVPADWSPPPLETVSTIIILDSQKIEIKQVVTDDHGRFSTSLPPGVYFLRVKESPFEATTGPFTITQSNVVTVEAYYDNGIR